MENMELWDWEPGERVILDTTQCAMQYEWQEEIYASPDGESIAAVVKRDDGTFTPCRNGIFWENSYDRVWYLRYTPNGRLTALVSDMDEWGLSVDDELWETRCASIWDTRFSVTGNAIAAAVQQDMQYGMALNGNLWPILYDNANQFTMNRQGTATAAAVQTRPIRQAEIQEYQAGCFSVAVDGIPWENEFVNVWTPVFDPASGSSVAAQVRLNLYEYTIAVDGMPWDNTYTSVWEPVFSPNSKSIAAPIRKNGAWGLAVDGSEEWRPNYYQLWHHQFTPSGKRLVAIGAVSFGKWTVVENNQPWKHTFDLVTDLSVGADDSTIAASATSDGKWLIIVNDRPWPNLWERVWAPVISPKNRNVAAKVRKNGRFTTLMNGRPACRGFERMWDPIFSPDGEMLMIRAVEHGQYIRLVVPVKTLY